ncbi:MAG: riboflavin synthase [Ruminococcus sp.]|nr:riboflavin synthase [Ruminococcus sp.]
MFTGIIEEVGTVRRLTTAPHRCELELAASRVLEGTQIGDSIAVNGVCLTVIRIGGDSFTADVMPETLRCSNLGQLKTDSAVNLERAMAANGRFGGHLVAGHIDGTGMIRAIQPEGNAKLVTISAAPQLLRYVVEKDSIAIDGISLTVVQVTRSDFTVSLIPHTGEETTLLRHRPGEMVNLETDIIGKYVEKLMQPKETGVTADLLRKSGFLS